MKGKDVVHSSGKDDWATPKWLFDRLNKHYEFGLDAAASDANHLCPNYFTEQNNALTQSWAGYGNVFLNPPYNQNTDFITKAWEESTKGTVVVCLIPARTDTNYFHTFCMAAAEICFIKGRLKFSESENAAPFPSCLVIFDDKRNTGTPKLTTLAKDRYG